MAASNRTTKRKRQRASNKQKNTPTSRQPSPADEIVYLTIDTLVRQLLTGSGMVQAQSETVLQCMQGPQPPVWSPHIKECAIPVQDNGGEGQEGTIIIRGAGAEHAFRIIGDGCGIHITVCTSPAPKIVNGKLELLFDNGFFLRTVGNITDAETVMDQCVQSFQWWGKGHPERSPSPGEE